MAWPDLKQIEVGDQTTVIRAALIDNTERVVHMNANSHLGAKPTNQGHSIGRFEDGALVVDTTDFPRTRRAFEPASRPAAASTWSSVFN